MLQQMEVAELVQDQNRRQAEKSQSYACGLLITTLMIMMFGLTMLYSTSYASDGGRFFHTQLVWAGLGVGAAAATVLLGYRRLGNWSVWLMAVVIVLLLVTDFCFPAIKGAHRWIVISLGGRAFSFQPSEMAKPVLALFAAKVVSEHLRQIADWRQWPGLLPMAGYVALVLLLVMAGKDLGTTLLLGAAMVVLVIVGGIQPFFWIMPLIAAAGIFFAIEAFSPERLSRITSFLNPEQVASDDGYQLWNSLLALGSGNWTGIGFMESRMKQKYLPEAHTDFILSVVGEELGLAGTIAVIVLYLAFGYFALKLSLNSRSRYGMLLGVTITVMILWQAIINIGVVSGGLPTKGIPAPLISYGGSSLLMNMVMVGLLISVALENVPGLTENWWWRPSRTDQTGKI